MDDMGLIVNVGAQTPASENLGLHPGRLPRWRARFRRDEPQRATDSTAGIHTPDVRFQRTEH
jgi:hypothetical protein